MNDVSPGARTDSDLLSLASLVLRENGYIVEATKHRFDLLLAENNFFIVVVVATSTIEGLMVVEPLALQTLLDRIESSELGAKKWDTYLVMLTQEKSSDDDEVTRSLYALNYDTSRLRRIVHTGVSPVREDMNRALASFLEPESSVLTGMPQDGLELLRVALGIRGVDEELANRAIRAFKQGGSLDDIL